MGFSLAWLSGSAAKYKDQYYLVYYSSGLAAWQSKNSNLLQCLGSSVVRLQELGGLVVEYSNHYFNSLGARQTKFMSYHLIGLAIWLSNSAAGWLSSLIQDLLLEWLGSSVVKYRNFFFSGWTAQQSTKGSIASLAWRLSSQVQELFHQWSDSSVVKKLDLSPQWLGGSVVKYRYFFISGQTAQQSKTQDLSLQWLGSSVDKCRNLFSRGQTAQQSNTESITSMAWQLSSQIQERFSSTARQPGSLIQDWLLLWLGGSVFKYRNFFLQ